MKDRFEALDRLVVARRSMAFDWVTHDCVRFPFAVIEALGFQSPFDVLSLRGWGTELGALRAVRDFAGPVPAPLEVCAEKLCAAYGAFPVARGFQSRGDLVFCPSDDRFGGFCGVIYPSASGEFCAAFRDGLIWQSLPARARVFRLPLLRV